MTEKEENNIAVQKLRDDVFAHIIKCSKNWHSQVGIEFERIGEVDWFVYKPLKDELAMLGFELKCPNILISGDKRWPEISLTGPIISNPNIKDGMVMYVYDIDPKQIEAYVLSSELIEINSDELEEEDLDEIESIESEEESEEEPEEPEIVDELQHDDKFDAVMDELQMKGGQKLKTYVPTQDEFKQRLQPKLAEMEVAELYYVRQVLPKKMFQMFNLKLMELKKSIDETTAKKQTHYISIDIEDADTEAFSKFKIKTGCPTFENELTKKGWNIHRNTIDETINGYWIYVNIY